jgi:hypothetical protein
MTREEFERTVHAMKAEGVPLTMPNLMLRTEMPRYLIEDWLEEMNDAAKRPPPTSKRAEAGAEDLLRKVGGLKDEVMRAAAKAAVREKLGLDTDEDDRPVHGARGTKTSKDLRVGAGLGLVLGPMGFFYAAPFSVAITASVAYLAAVIGLQFVPVLGSLLVAYIVPIVHISSALVGAGYTWRYNRTGRRGALLPNTDDNRR